MSRIESAKRILSTDFSEKDKPLVDKLAFVVNPFMEQVSSVLNGNLDFTNIRVIEKALPVVVDSNNNLINATAFQNTTGQRIKGILCLDAKSRLNTNIFVTNTPFISFEENANLITINKISGLVNSNMITSIAVSNPGEITSPGHGLVSGQKVRIYGVSTTPSIITSVYTITVLDENTFTIPVNITAVADAKGFYRTTENSYNVKIIAFT